MTRQTTAYIALGGNLGDRADYINKAVNMLVETDSVQLLRVGKIIETTPLTGRNQPDYLNTVAEIQTTLTPERLLHRLTDIENALGRTRTEKWAPRTIDLDLLLFGTEIINTTHLTVPHPQMHLRWFVLNGLCQLNPDLPHPLLNRPVAELAARLNGADYILNPTLPQLICIAGVIGVGKTTLAKALAAKLKAELLPEAYDTNPYLPRVYAGRKDLALDSQLYFLQTRLAQLSRNSLKPRQIAVTDYIFEKEIIYADCTLAPHQLTEYKKRFHAVADNAAAPVLTIYLQARCETCLRRIHKRNRPYEQRIELKFLQTLHRDYEKLFTDWTRCPLIRLSAADFNCTDPSDIKTLANETKFYLAL